MKEFDVCSADNSVQTVVSFDQGGEWVPLKKPQNSKCDATAKDEDAVRTAHKVIQSV